MPIERALESAAVSLVLKKVVSKDTIDFFFKWDLDRPLLEKLRTTLLVIHAVLNHADERQIDDEHVKEWLDQVRAATYDAEDILADVSTKALESQNNQNQVCNFLYDLVGASVSTKEAIDFKMKDVAAYLNPFKEQIDSKMKSLIERLEDLAKQKDILRLREDVKGISSVMYKRSPTTPLVNLSQVYGRDVEKMEIIEKITSNTVEVDHDVCVVPIVGMGGVGKTTLAQIVFNDEVVKGHFELKAWACVSDEFDVIRITKILIESATRKSCHLNNLELLQDELRLLLNKKKFLLVLDDVWNENYGNWEDLQLPFGVGAPGSSIIVTTRNEKVASTIVGAAGPFFNLKEMSKGDCWSLLEHIAFPRRDSSAYPELKAMNEEMVEKCKGLPLAAKILGGLLRVRLDESHWKDILQSVLWDKPSNNILPVLRLSYHHLPPYLKRCFAYCSLFPKDYEFDMETLVLLWMAEGFVNHHGENKRIEENGCDYFHELLSRSFFQQVSHNNSRFVMHDLIHDLAKFVSGKICVRLEDTVNGVERFDMLANTRHLSYLRRSADEFQKFKPLYESKILRTFLALNALQSSLGQNMYHISSRVVDHFLPKLRSLRVLSLRSYYITSLPDSIGNMKQLHYLDLSHSTIEELPESTSRLYNLQTLILFYCRYLKKLPANMGYLINLRHLDTDGSSLQMMPPHMGRLKFLQKLSNFIVSNEKGSSIGELKDLQHLHGKIHISGLENVTSLNQAIEARLKLKHHLTELTLEWARKDDNGTRSEILEEQILEALQPHESLTMLTIKYYGGTEFPSWIGDPSFTKMVYVHLYGCSKSVSLPSLGQLPLLKELIIEGMDKVKLIGPEFYDDNYSSLVPFPLLEVLKFENMQEWEKWDFPEDGEVLAFPRLRELSVFRCPKLIQFWHRFPSLEKLRVKLCPELATFSQVPSSASSRVEEFPLLRVLTIEGCTKLNQLPCPLASLIRLEIDGCKQLGGLPKLAKLQAFDLTDSNIKLLDWLVELRSLTSLHINSIPIVKCLPNGFIPELTELQNLKISACSDLENLSNEHAGLVHLASLKSLTVSHCPKLIALPTEAKQLPPLLEYWDMRYCHNLQNLTADLSGLVSLTELRLENCPSLESFPEEGLPPLLKRLVVQACTTLKTLPEKTFRNNISLEYLEIGRCSSLESILPQGDLPATLKNLRVLHCKSLKALPRVMFTKEISLQYLEVDNCFSLESFPEGQLPTTLLRVEISDCQNLQSLPSTLVNLVNLECLEVRECSVLEHFPSGKWHTSNLRLFKVEACDKLKSLPDCLHKLRSLQDLEVSGCSSLASMPKQGFPTNLKSLTVKDCKIINPMRQWKLHKLNSLIRLVIGGLPGQVSFANDSPLPYSITELIIRELPELETISEGMGSLSRLETLVIGYCDKLNALPEKGLPATLSSLTIRNCAMLKPRCQKDGEDWSKIADIPYLEVD